MQQVRVLRMINNVEQERQTRVGRLFAEAGKREALKERCSLFLPSHYELQWVLPIL